MSNNETLVMGMDILSFEAQKRVLASTKLMVRIEQSRASMVDYLAEKGHPIAAMQYLQEIEEAQTVLKALW